VPVRDLPVLPGTVTAVGEQERAVDADSVGTGPAAVTPETAAHLARVRFEDQAMVCGVDRTPGGLYAGRRPAFTPDPAAQLELRELLARAARQAAAGTGPYDVQTSLWLLRDPWTPRPAADGPTDAADEAGPAACVWVRRRKVGFAGSPDGTVTWHLDVRGLVFSWCRRQARARGLTGAANRIWNPPRK
jgi:hypothetical protein